MDLVCQGLKSCGDCCLSECKWVTFDNSSESCHSTVENLEDVVKMVDKGENCTAPFIPPDEELIKDLSEIFGGLTGGIILTLICICCYGYFHLTQEQRQRLGRIAAIAVVVMEFLVRLWDALSRRRPDEVPLLDDAENPAVIDPAPQQELPALQGAGEGQNNLVPALEDEEEVLPNYGLPFQLVLMDPVALNQVVIEDEEEGDGEGEDGGQQQQAGNDDQDAELGIGNAAEGVENQEAAGPAPQQEGEDEGPLFVIGAGGPTNSSEDDDNEILPPPNRSAPRRNPTRSSKSSSVRKIAQLRRNRQI